jgi:hypothetical protein
MGEFIGMLIEFVARIWHADAQIRGQSPMTSGSQFDRESRRFVAWLCGGIIVLLLILGLAVWWFTR